MTRLLKRIAGKGRRLARESLFQANHQVERIFAKVAAPPRITARAAYVMDVETRQPIFAKNAGLRHPPASLTKLATAIAFVRASEGQWHEPVEALPCDLTGDTTVRFDPGTSASRRDLLIAMLIASSNDAAMMVARMAGASGRGGLDPIVADLGLKRTRFVNPHGQDAPGQVSTARDLALLASHAFAIPAIRHACALRGHEVLHIAPSGTEAEEIRSTVRILGEPGIVAGKTGSTYRALGCLALLAQKNGREIIVVLLGSKVRFDYFGVIDASDRRYEDARAILASLPPS